MSIETLYIPTIGRENSQITYSNIPDSWKSKVVFVIQEKDASYDFFKDKNVVTTANSIGIAKTRHEIAKLGKGKKYAILDDDIEFLIRPDPTTNSKRKVTDKEFDEAMTLMSTWLDLPSVVSTGLAATWSPYPSEWVETECFRPCCNVFYNGNTLPVDKINWDYLEVSEDFWVMMQILDLSLKNKISFKFFINSGASQKSGGCSGYRTLDLHNDCFKKLKEKYPKYVSLKEKIVKSGGFSNVPQIKGVIQWKKLYKDSFKKNV